MTTAATFDEINKIKMDTAISDAFLAINYITK